MALAPPPTILARKHEFISEQTRLLSQPLSPSRTWRASNSSAARAAGGGHATGAGAAHQPLPDKAVDSALVRLNHKIQQHSHRVYSPVATRHVAEQLDKLYMQDRNAAAAAAHADGEDVEGAGALRNLINGTDFADPETIDSLPSAWPSARDAEAHPPEAARYAEQAARLRDLSARRAEATARVARLRAMQNGLAPFRKSTSAEDTSRGDGDGTTNAVQKNLVTRNGELERELERMRILMARVGDRVAHLTLSGGDDAQRLRAANACGGHGAGMGQGATDDDSADSLFREGDAMVVDIEDDGRRKVADLLDRF